MSHRSPSRRSRSPSRHSQSPSRSPSRRSRSPSRHSRRSAPHGMDTIEIASLYEYIGSIQQHAVDMDHQSFLLSIAILKALSDKLTSDGTTVQLQQALRNVLTILKDEAVTNDDELTNVQSIEKTIRVIYGSIGVDFGTRITYKDNEKVVTKPAVAVRFTDFEKDVIENLDELRRLTDNESTVILYKRVDRLYKDFNMLVSSGHTLDLQHKLREDIIILHLHDSDMIPREQTLLHNIEKGLRVLYKYQLGLDFGERIIT